LFIAPFRSCGPVRHSRAQRARGSSELLTEPVEVQRASVLPGEQTREGQHSLTLSRLLPPSGVAAPFAIRGSEAPEDLSRTIECQSYRGSIDTIGPNFFVRAFVFIVLKQSLIP